MGYEYRATQAFPHTDRCMPDRQCCGAPDAPKEPGLSFPPKARLWRRQRAVLPWLGLAVQRASWVVCCATPTWVVSLAMMGMSASLALWLEPLVIFITITGFLRCCSSPFGSWPGAVRLETKTSSPNLKLHSALDGVRS